MDIQKFINEITEKNIHYAKNWIKNFNPHTQGFLDWVDWTYRIGKEIVRTNSETETEITEKLSKTSDFLEFVHKAFEYNSSTVHYIVLKQDNKQRAAGILALSIYIWLYEHTNVFDDFKWWKRKPNFIVEDMINEAKNQLMKIGKEK